MPIGFLSKQSYHYSVKQGTKIGASLLVLLLSHTRNAVGAEQVSDRTMRNYSRTVEYLSVIGNPHSLSERLYGSSKSEPTPS